MKKTIGSKIFAIAIGLVLLMVAATFISSYHLNRVNGQIKLVSTFYLPLDQHMGEVRAYGLYEIIQFDRLSNQKPKSLFEDSPALAQQLLKEIGGCEKNSRSDMLRKVREKFSDAAQRQRVVFELMESCGSEELASATRLVEQGLADPQVRDDPEQSVKFAQLKQEIADIPEARKVLHDTLLTYFRELAYGNDRSVEVVRQQVDRDWVNFAKQINDVTVARLHPYSLEIAAKASELERRALVLSLAMTAMASILGLLFAAWLTRNLVKPVRELLLGTKAIEDGDLDIHIQVSSADEIAMLATSFNHMVGELRQKESITETFGKYVDPRIVKGLIEDKQFSQLGEKRIMTVFFSDLEGFTAISEKFSAEGVVKLLNQYFTLMSEPIRKSNGIIDKYIGDAIMAFWGPPFTAAAEHPKLACLAALEQKKRLKQFETQLPDLLGIRRDLPRLNMRIGISTGDVIVGSIGSDVAKSYTVIGDNVNLASRLESANKNYGTNILIGGEVWDMVKDVIECREIDWIRVAGKTQPIRIFEVMGEKGKLDDAMAELKKHFETGLAAYRASKWDEATQEFEKCIELNPQEKAAATFLSRVTSFRENPPSNDWDGIWNFSEK
ncbi:MAG TPA: adenylate/guanylate cyclase domain-containing protein [Gallionellaceae bacterium]|nr:adenylate/guanylate cyclase domain-containing protein [Gallionellaceae bacterium]